MRLKLGRAGSLSKCRDKRTPGRDCLFSAMLVGPPDDPLVRHLSIDVQ